MADDKTLDSAKVRLHDVFRYRRHASRASAQHKPPAQLLRQGRASVPPLVAAVFFLIAATGGATAQFVCVDTSASAQGATATGNTNNTACGPLANAAGNGSSNTASGYGANASGANSGNTASGFFANASGDSSVNTAIGFGANASGGSAVNTAIGYGANASGTGTSNTAVGRESIATGADAAAFGYGAQATFANTTAIGPGAVATGANQMTFGNASITSYRFQQLPSIAGAATDKFVTVDASGNLRTVTAPTGVTVVNDLTTGGTTAALSAQQGVVLNGLVSTAQTTANTAVTNAAAAQTTANNAFALASTALQADGSVIATGNLNMGGNQINNVAGPTLGTDAANKTYVDSQVGTANAASAAAQTTANTALFNAATAQTTANTAVTNAAAAQGTANTALTNAATAQTTANTAVTDAAAAQGTANTALTNAATAQTTANTAFTNAATAQGTANTALANAATAQTTASGALQRNGGTMTGAINMGGNTISNVAGPINAGDATNKSYVDTQVATISGGLAGVQSQIDSLSRKDHELAEGIAIAVALDAPVLRAGQTFAVRGGWGNYEGSNAVALTAAGLVATDIAGPGSSVVLDAGFGFGTTSNTAAARAGVTIGW